MNRVLLGRLVVVSLLAGVPLAVTHCSGSDTPALSADGGSEAASGDDASGSSSGSSGGSGSGSGSSSGSSGGSSGGTTDGGSSSGGDGGGTDGGTATCAMPDGGGPCTPGQVPCGTTLCSTPDYCCVTTASNKTTCDMSNQNCVGTAYHCDETADCPAGNVCCLNFAGLTNSTTCQTACMTGSPKMCRSDTECASGKCIVQSCLKPGAGNTTVEACSLIPGCTAL
jgi:hypothetical protein